MHSLKRITPNKQRAKSLYSMAKQTEEMLLQTHKKYASIKKKKKGKKKLVYDWRNYVHRFTCCFLHDIVYYSSKESGYES